MTVSDKARTKKLFCVESWTEVRKWDVERTWVWAEDVDDAIEIIDYPVSVHTETAEDSYSDGTEYEVHEANESEIPEGVTPYEIDKVRESENERIA